MWCSECTNVLAGSGGAAHHTSQDTASPFAGSMGYGGYSNGTHRGSGVAEALCDGAHDLYPGAGAIAVMPLSLAIAHPAMWVRSICSKTVRLAHTADWGA